MPEKNQTPRGYWKGKEGLERAVTQIQAFNKKEGRSPKTRDPAMRGIVTAVKKGRWKQFGISSWSVLIAYCGLDPAGKWRGKSGLLRAKKEILEIVKKLNKTPTRNQVSRGIRAAARRGEWKDEGITSWNDVLRYCGLQPRHEMSKWTGKKGFERAKEEVITVAKRLEKTPIRDDVSDGISDAIYRGEYREYRVTSWNDLLIQCGLEVIHFIGKWKGKEGLQRAKDALVNLAIRLGRTPKRDEVPEASGISQAIKRGAWKEFGITEWNDLLRYCGLEIYIEPKLWVGTKGLEKAKKQIRVFADKTNRTPRYDDFENIGASVSDGRWREFGIFTWNDLLESCRLDLNLEQKRWVGKEGLEKAKQEIQILASQLGRTPTQNDIPKGLESAVYKGHWTKFGISTLTDLMVFCGLRPNEPIFGDLWIKWEEWCNKVVTILYPMVSQLQPRTRLPNGKVPDFNFRDQNSVFVIGDAKLNVRTMGIKEDITHYIDYCDRLEFWCLFGEREAEFYAGKKVRYVTPQQILSRLRDLKLRNKLEKELQEIYRYDKSSLDRKPDKSEISLEFLL